MTIKRSHLATSVSLLQERIEKANPRRKLTAEEAKRLAKLEAIAEKLKRGENVQNRQQSESAVGRRAFLMRTIY